MDVLDFIVVFSPYDKFDFYVAQGEGQERPTMAWEDNSCVVGPGAGGSVIPAPSPFVSGNETMSVGHLEVLGMADLTNAAIGPASGASFRKAPQVRLAWRRRPSTAPTASPPTAASWSPCWRAPPRSGA